MLLLGEHPKDQGDGGKKFNLLRTIVLSQLVAHRNLARRAKELGADRSAQDPEEETAELYSQVASQLQSAALGEWLLAELRMRQWAARGRKPGKSFLETWEEEWAGIAECGEDGVRHRQFMMGMRGDDSVISLRMRACALEILSFLF